MQTEKRFAGRVVLVTGASRGIGRAVGIGFAREGAHVILLARTIGGLEELDDEIRAFGGTATLVTLDVRQADKVDQIGPSIYQRWGKLDVLVGNAGVLGPLSPLPHITSDAFTEVIETNLTANWRLMRTLEPLLRRSDAGRAIFVSSGAARSNIGVLGPLLRREGGAGGAGPYMGRRTRQHIGTSQHHQSRSHPNQHARQSLSGRGSQHAQNTGGHRSVVL